MSKILTLFHPMFLLQEKVKLALATSHFDGADLMSIPASDIYNALLLRGQKVQRVITPQAMVQNLQKLRMKNTTLNTILKVVPSVIILSSCFWKSIFLSKSISFMSLRELL